MTKEEMAKTIDHTLLVAYATQKDIKELCTEAKTYGFYSVCVNPVFVPFAVKELEGSSVKVCCVVGFPLGALPTELKVQEARWVLDQGAHEIDMVMNIGAFLEGHFDFVKSEFVSLKSLMPQKVLKVIIETCYLKNADGMHSDLVKKASELVLESGADYVKTSTGFGSQGATQPNLDIMLSVVKGTATKVKAAGGIKTQKQLIEYLSRGVARIGTSSGISLILGDQATSGY